MGERERDFRKPTRNHDSHSDLFWTRQLVSPHSAEAGAGPVAERARVDEFDAVGRPCGEASEMAIAVDFMAASEWGWLDDWPEVDTSILRDLSFIGGEARFGALPCICPLAGRTYRVLARQPAIAATRVEP